MKYSTCRRKYVEADTGCSSTCCLSLTCVEGVKLRFKLRYLFPLLIFGGEEQDESKYRLRHKTKQIRIKPPDIDHLPLRGNTTKVAKGAEHLQ